MTRAETELLAGEYVLGTLDAEARRRFAEEMSRDPALQDLVARWEQRLAPLDRGIAPIQPPPELWDRIEAEIEYAAHPDAVVTVRADEGAWKPFVPGVEKKQLLIDRAAGKESYLLRFAPGARLPPHRHRKVEECLMIEGETFVGGERYGAGDYVAVLAGSVHPVVSSDIGALVYISGEIHEAAG